VKKHYELIPLKLVLSHLKKERLASAATDVRIKREREPHGRHAGCLDNQQLLFKKKSLLARMV